HHPLALQPWEAGRAADARGLWIDHRVVVPARTARGSGGRPTAGTKLGAHARRLPVGRWRRHGAARTKGSSGGSGTVAPAGPGRPATAADGPTGTFDAAPHSAAPRGPLA